MAESHDDKEEKRCKGTRNETQVKKRLNKNGTAAFIEHVMI